jgi:hypothetical protein
VVIAPSGFSSIAVRSLASRRSFGKCLIWWQSWKRGNQRRRQHEQAGPGAGVYNALYYEDNLDILRRKIKDETVDLCYIDPPFNSKRNYNQIYNNIGEEDRAQATRSMRLTHEKTPVCSRARIAA